LGAVDPEAGRLDTVPKPVAYIEIYSLGCTGREPGKAPLGAASAPSRVTIAPCPDPIVKRPAAFAVFATGTVFDKTPLTLTWKLNVMPVFDSQGI
jgi:hypothetical protein